MKIIRFCTPLKDDNRFSKVMLNAKKVIGELVKPLWPNVRYNRTEVTLSVHNSFQRSDMV